MKAMNTYTNFINANADLNIWDSKTRTMLLAGRMGHNARHIDDDCFLICFDGDSQNYVQVTFDNYTPTDKFYAAIDSDGNEYKSYDAVRKLCFSKMVAR